MGEDWDSIYMQLCMIGYDMCDMPSSKAVVNQLLRGRGFTRHVCPDKCPHCYTVEEFSNEHPLGRYLLCTDSHVVPVIFGDYIDTWDSGNEVPMFYWSEGVS